VHSSERELSTIAPQIILNSYGTSIEFVVDAKFQQLHVAAKVKRAAPNEGKLEARWKPPLRLHVF
jgi:hypothetical protein